MQFPYPNRGIGVVAIFLIVAPPVQLIVAAYMEHSFIGGRQILFEIGQVFEQRVMPSLVLSYSVFMPPTFLAALWAAWRPAQGYALTLSGAILRMVGAGLICEAFFQIYGIIAGLAFRPDFIMIGIVQWILAGAISWAVAKRFKLAKSIV